MEGPNRFGQQEESNPGARTRPVLRRAGGVLLIAGIAMLILAASYYAYSAYRVASFTKQLQDQALVAQDSPTSVVPLPGDNSGTQPAPGLDGSVGVVQGSQPAGTPSPRNSAPPPVLSLVPTLTVPAATPVPKSLPAARIVISKIKLDVKVVDVGFTVETIDNQVIADWNVPDNAVGHLSSSANPGQQGNIVLDGHDDWKGEVFRYLENLKPGDQITLFTDNMQYQYVVKEMKLVQQGGVSFQQQQANAQYMDQTPDETLTLITCWPYGVDSHRLIVIAKPSGQPKPVTGSK